ncbi:MAG: ATP-binding protein [Bacilli bacterium]|jgi:primosomal protein DnaI|nr:ATP-binding protein [Bacilli bacterium]
MQKVNINNKIDENKYIKNIFKKYKDDDFFKNKYDEIKMKYHNAELSDIIDTINNQRLCQNCLGLSGCLQTTKGYYLGINEDGLFKKACSYLVKQENINYKFTNIIYTTFDLHEDLPSIKHIEINNDRSAIIKYINNLKLNKEHHQALYLYGPPGVGKTYIMMSILNDALLNNQLCALINISDLAQNLRGYLFSDDKNDNKLFHVILNKLKKVEVLFIDDIGSERSDSIIRDEILFPILDYRMQHQLLTYFTSNIKQTDLAKQYRVSNKNVVEPIKGDRLLERIKVLSKELKLSEKKSRRI